MGTFFSMPEIKKIKNSTELVGKLKKKKSGISENKIPNRENFKISEIFKFNGENFLKKKTANPKEKIVEKFG